MMKMRQLLAAAVVLAALAAILYWSNHRKPAAIPASADAGTAKLPSLTRDDIVKLEINKKGGDDVVLNRLAPRTWKITSPKSLNADMDSVSTALVALAPMSGVDLLEDKPDDLKNYGLADPLLKVTITDKDGKSQTTLYGDDNPTSDTAYMMLGGDPRLYTVLKSTKTILDKGVNEMRDKRLVPINYDTLVGVQLTGPKLDLTFGSKDGQWIIRNPRGLRGDNSALDSVVNSLKIAYMDPATSEEDKKQAVKSFAAGTPVVDIKVTDASGSCLLQIRKDKGAYYGKTTALEGVYKLSDTFGGEVDKNLEAFRDKNLFDFGTDTPDKVEMHDGSKTYLLTRSGNNWVSDGKKMEPITVQDFLSSIRALVATKFVTAGFSRPALTIGVTSEDGKSIEKVELSKSGKDYIAKRKNDPTLYEVDANKIISLQESAAVLKPAEASTAKK